MSYSEDYKAGWAAARAQYQQTGGVQPHPPEPAKEPEPEPAPPKKAAPRKKTGGE